MYELNEYVKYFFECGLSVLKTPIKQHKALHFTIYDEEKNKCEDVDINTYMYERLLSKIKDYFKNKNIKLNKEEIENITKRFLDIYYPKFLKDLYD